MSKLSIILLMLCVLAVSAIGVRPYTDYLDDAAGSDPLGGGFWDEVTGTTGAYTGTGHYHVSSAVSTEVSGLSATIGEGDFTAELHLDNFQASLGPTLDPDYEYTEFMWYVYDTTNQLQLQITNWAGAIYFKALQWNGATWVNYTQPIVTDSSSIHSLNLRISWKDDPAEGKGGQWDMEYNLNDGGWDAWHTITSDQYTEDPTEDRYTQFWAVGHQDYGSAYSVLSEVSADVDQFSITPTGDWWKAINPSPKDGGAVSPTGVVLSWDTGEYAPVPIVEHEIYFGTEPNFIGKSPVATYPVETTSHVVGDLTAGVTYYWKVDEVTAEPNTAGGDIWSFTAGGIEITPVDQRVDDGEPFAITAAFTGDDTNITYQWYRNGKAIPDATDNVYGGNAQPIDHAQFYCVATDTVTSDTFTTDTVYVYVNQLIGQWQFEDNLQDSTVHGHDGQIAQGTVGYVDGPFGGKAIDFPGASAVIIDPNDESFFDLYDELTVSCWMKSTSATAWEFFFAKDGLFSGWFLGRYIGAGANFRIYPAELTGGKDIYDGQWHLVTGVFENGTHQLYVDGALAIEQTGVVIAKNDTPLTIGGVLYSGNYDTFSFTGQIDDVRFYNYAQDYIEIADVYCQDQPEGCYVCQTPPEFDFDGDCITGIGDLAILAAKWLECGRYPETSCP